MSERFALVFFALAALVPLSAAAQPAGPEQFAAGAAERNPDDDIVLRVNAGANLAYGNARNFGATLGALFNLRQGEHAFLAEATWSYGIASTRVRPNPGPMEDPDYSFGPWTDNANNFNLRLRFDEYITPDDAIFTEARLRYDPFAFLEPQFTFQVGYQRVLFREDKHRLWFEVGVDYSFQLFGEPLPATDAMGVVPANQLSERSIFAWKGLIGYTNETNSGFTYNTRLEVLGTIVESVPTPAVDGPASFQEAEPGHLRIQWVNQFRSVIEDWLQISVDITGRLDSLPAGQLEVWQEEADQPTQMFDLLATLNLVGNFDLDGEPEEEEEEPECPACEECPVCEECPPQIGEPPVMEEEPPEAGEPEAPSEGDEAAPEEGADAGGADAGGADAEGADAEGAEPPEGAEGEATGAEGAQPE